MRASAQKSGKLVDLLEQMEFYVYVVDQDGNLQFANAAVRRDFGPPTGRQVLRLLQGFAPRPVSGCRKDDVPTGSARRRRWYSSHTGKTYEVIDSPLSGQDGPAGRLNILRPIGVGDQTQGSSGESSSRYRDLVNNSSDFLWRIDLHGRFSFVSPSSMSMFGYEQEELQGGELREGPLGEKPASLAGAPARELLRSLGDRGDSSSS